MQIRGIKAFIRAPKPLVTLAYHSAGKVRRSFGPNIAIMSEQAPIGISGLDRKKMEEERLARQAKKRPAEEVQMSSSKAVKLDSGSRAISPPKSSRKTNQYEAPSTTPRDGNLEAVDSTLEFPFGAIRKTWAFGHERHNDIKIEEVLRKKELRIAVISSFNWDFDWLVTKFDAKTKFVFVIQARNASERQHYEKEFDGISKIRLCFPPMSGNPYNCMHSKLMLLFYPHHLRVVVPSANFVPGDWGETGILENSVFLIDLARLPQHKQGHANDTLNSFSKELLRFIDAMKLDDDVKLGVLNFDFTNAKNFGFLHTIGGTHLRKAAEYTGLLGLGRQIRSLDLQTSGQVEVEMAASSVGAIDRDTIDRLYTILHGDRLGRTTSTKRKTEDYIASKAVKDSNAFHLIFPTRETVAQSTGGPENAGTIFLKPDYFVRPNFPSDLIRDYISQRKGMLSHNKLIFVRSPTNAFFYMGSANLSQAAWGKVVYDKETQGPKLTANNWECGVLIPVVRNGVRVPVGEEAKDMQSQDERAPASKDNGQPGKEDGQTVLSMDVFDRVLGVPWHHPAPEYRKGQKPWSAST